MKQRSCFFAALFFFVFLIGVINAQDSISLKYDGQAVDLAAFQVQTVAGQSNEGYDGWRKTYTAPDGKLRITVNGKTYKKYPVTEYAVLLSNLSQNEDTKIGNHIRGKNELSPQQRLRGIKGDF